MSSMGEVRDEGAGQWYDWITQHVSDAGMTFLENAEKAGTLTEEQVEAFLYETGQILSEDPYGSSVSTVSVWDQGTVKRAFIVTAYHVSRRYGGPEEGGWWYDHADPLSEAYAQSHDRAYVIAGPFKDREDAAEVMRNLNAMEQIGMPKGVRSAIEWRIDTHAPMSTPRQVYC